MSCLRCKKIYLVMVIENKETYLYTKYKNYYKVNGDENPGG